MKKYEKVKTGPAGPGRELEVKVGEQAPVQPGSNLQGFGTQRIGTKNRTNRNSMPEDTLREMNEGGRSEPPPEWRGKFEGYKSKIARSKVAASRPRTPQQKPSAGK